jgi:hypothetical protein
MNLFFTKHRKFVVIVALLFLLYSAIGFVLFPALLKQAAVRYSTKFLGRTVAIAKIDFNPFTMSLACRGLRIEEAKGGTFFFMDRLYANFEPFASLLRRAWVFKKLVLIEPTVSIVRNANGELNFADLLLLHWPHKFNARFHMILLMDGKIAFSDAVPPGGFSTTIRPITADLEDFSTRADHENSFSIGAVSEAGEKLSWNGFFTLGTLSSHGDIAVDGIQIKKYYPYLEDRLNFTILDGTITARIPYDFDLAQDRFKAVLREGALAVHSLKVNEGGNTGPLFGFADCAIAGANVDLQRKTVEIASLLINGGNVSLRRLSDNSFNVQHIVNPARAPLARKAETSTEWKLSVGEIRVADFGAEVNEANGREIAGWKELLLSKPSFQTKPVAASIAGISLKEGKLEFADSSVTPPVSVALTGLDIRIGGFSSENAQMASVAGSAAIDSTARLQIYGATNPIREGGKTRLRALLQNFDLATLGPYAAKYLGYELSAGELGVDSAWSIQGRKLGARNTIEIDRLKLGRRTANKDATKLPVRLAIDLIEDSSGKIVLEVPIEGTLDDPKVDLGKAFFGAMFSQFKQIAASPFVAFAARLGVAGKELGFQEFSPGSAELVPEEIGKLDSILEGLNRWPELMLDIEGSTDLKKDNGDLRLLAANRAKAVMEYLLRQGNLKPNRIFLIDDTNEDVPNKGSRALLYLKDQYQDQH